MNARSSKYYEEHREHNKQQYAKRYQEEHMQQIRQHREHNKKHINHIKQQWYRQNKERLKERYQATQWYQQHKERLKERYQATNKKQNTLQPTDGQTISKCIFV